MTHHPTGSNAYDRDPTVSQNTTQKAKSVNPPRTQGTREGRLTRPTTGERAFGLPSLRATLESSKSTTLCRPIT